MANDGEETLEQLQAKLKAIADIKKLNEETGKLTTEQLDKLRQISGIEERILKSVRNEYDSRHTALELLDIQIGKLDELIGKEGKIFSQHVAKQLKQEAEIERRQLLIKQYEREIKAGNDQNAAELENLKKLEAQYKLVEAAIPDAIKAIRQPGALKLAAGAFLGAMAANQLRKFGKAVVNLGFSLHDAEAEFMKTTGASKEFAGGLQHAYIETRKYGVSVEDASKSMAALHAGFTDFTFASETQREALTKTGAVLGRMGVSHQDFAASVQISTKALGMSTKEAAQNMLNMEKFAENIGVAPAEMAKQFAGAGNMMAKMGDQGVDAFKDLAIASKVTGMEMQKILQITDKFDTFEGAAEMAGKLNAAIGGNFVNAMDLMMATDPAERFDMIRDSLDQAGLEFDNMSYYQRKFYTDSLGLSDVSELALVMSGNTETLSGATEKNSQSYEDAAKRAQTMASFQDKLNMVFAQMIPIITPIIDKTAKFILWVAESPKVIGAMVVVMGALAGIMAVLAIKAGIAAIGVLALTAPIWGIVAAVTALITGIGALVGWLFSKDVGHSTFPQGLNKLKEEFAGLSAEMEGLPTETTTKRMLSTVATNNTVAKATPAGRGGGALEEAEVRKAQRARGTGAAKIIEQPLIIQLGEKEFGRAVLEIFRKEGEEEIGKLIIGSKQIA